MSLVRNLRNRLAALGTLLLASLVCLAPAQAGDVGFVRAAGGVFNVPITSLKEARFKRVIKQEYDFSCGSAALATLLSYHYETPVNETAVFIDMFNVGDQGRIKKYGFSLLDMKQYLAAHDLRADGVRVDLVKLMEIGVPAIALIETQGYKHFVVVKGMRGDRVLVGDPARGTRTIPREKFALLWNGIAFVIRDKASVGKTHFNRDDDWSVVAAAPFGTAMARQSLSSFNVHLKGTLTNAF